MMKNNAREEAVKNLASKIYENHLLTEFDEIAEKFRSGELKPFIEEPTMEEMRCLLYGDPKSKIANSGLAFLRMVMQSLASLLNPEIVPMPVGNFAYGVADGFHPITVPYEKGNVEIFISVDEDDHSIEFYSTDATLKGKKLVIRSSSTGWVGSCEFVEDTTTTGMSVISMMRPADMPLEAIGDLSPIIED